MFHPEVRDPCVLRFLIELSQFTERRHLFRRKVAYRLTGRAKADIVFITKLDRLCIARLVRLHSNI